MDEEEGFRMDSQTNVDMASRVVEDAASHEGTVAGWHSGWLAWFIRWPCQPEVLPQWPMPQPVDDTEPGHGDFDRLVQHMGAQFQTISRHNPPFISSRDLDEPDASGDKDEGV